MQGLQRLPRCSLRSVRGRGCIGDAVPPRPSHPQAWQAMKAQLCSSGAVTRLCLGSGPGWDSSPRQHRQTLRQEVPPQPGLGAMHPAQCGGKGWGPRAHPQPLTPDCPHAAPASSCPKRRLQSTKTPQDPPASRCMGRWAPVAHRGRPRRRDNNRLIERWLEKSLQTMWGLRTGASSQTEVMGGCAVAGRDRGGRVAGGSPPRSIFPPRGGIQPWKRFSILTPTCLHRGSQGSDPARLQAGRSRDPFFFFFHLKKRSQK